MAFNNLPTADAAGHVPVCTSEWWWARAGAGRLYLHVSCGAEQCQWGLGVWHFARHRAVGPAARELHQPRRWVWHMGRPWVRKSITMLFFFLLWCNDGTRQIVCNASVTLIVRRSCVVCHAYSATSVNFSVCVWFSGPTLFSTVPLRPSPAAL